MRELQQWRRGVYTFAPKLHVQFVHFKGRRVDGSSCLAPNIEPAQMQAPGNVNLEDGLEVHRLSVKGCHALGLPGQKHCEPLRCSRLFARADGERYEFGYMRHERAR